MLLEELHGRSPSRSKHLLSKDLAESTETVDRVTLLLEEGTKQSTDASDPLYKGKLFG